MIAYLPLHAPRSVCTVTPPPGPESCSIRLTGDWSCTALPTVSASFSDTSCEPYAKRCFCPCNTQIRPPTDFMKKRKFRKETSYASDPNAGRRIVSTNPCTCAGRHHFFLKTSIDVASHFIAAPATHGLSFGTRRRSNSIGSIVMARPARLTNGNGRQSEPVGNGVQ